MNLNQSKVNNLFGGVVIKQQPKTNNQTLDHAVSERGIRVI